MIRVVYLGTPDFSVAPLKKLLSLKDYVEVVAVVTNVDKPVGRKQIITACPVKKYAIERGIPVLSYSKIRLEGVNDLINIKPDLMITCAFGQILSQEILDIPKLGTINIHASLLPKYRGASPIHYAILNGEKKTGITIMRTDVGIDTGDIILSEALEIGDDETCGELFNRLSILGADCIEKAIKQIIEGTIVYTKQKEEDATFTKIIKKELALINWKKSNEEVKNQIRAFNPSPVAYTFLNGEQLKIFSVQISDGKGAPGEIIDCNGRLEIACGKGSIIINELQKAGGKQMPSKAFLLGNKLQNGIILG